MAKKKSAPVEAEAAVVFDVTGQPGGPNPEEQELADAAQRDLIAQIKRDREAAVADEKARGADVPSKIERAAKRQAVISMLPDLVDDLNKRLVAVLARIDALEARIDALEAKVSPNG